MYNMIQVSGIEPSLSSCLFILPCFIEVPVFIVNNIDPDHTPRSAASDLGLIWVYTFSQCPFYERLGINGLILLGGIIPQDRFTYQRNMIAPNTPSLVIIMLGNTACCVVAIGFLTFNIYYRNNR